MTDPKSFDWKKYINEALNATNFCAIASVDKKSGVWVNPVYFAWDKEYTFYFISQMPSRHMQNLQSDKHVSLAIYKTEQVGDVIGIQLEGEAKILTEAASKDEIQHAFDTYYGRAGKGPDVQGYINNPTWLYVKIIPKNMYYFDTRFFEEERQDIPIEKLI